MALLESTLTYVYTETIREQNRKYTKKRIFFSLDKYSFQRV